MKPALVLGVVLLSSCASMEQMGTPTNFAECAAFDVVTTTTQLANNRIHEINPLTKALFVHGVGKVAGTVIPVVGLSIAGYYLLKWINKPYVTATATVATCLSAGRNLVIK